MTNAKRIFVNVVPRRAVIKNFQDDDPRLPAVQITIMKKVDGEVKKFAGKKKGNKELPKVQLPLELNKFFDRYMKIPCEEFLSKPVGGIRTQWTYMDETEIAEEAK